MDFNPNGPGLRNGNFIGLPFNEETANIILLPALWDVTTSYSPGTAQAPELIREASLQLDLYDADVPDAWKRGICMAKTPPDALQENDATRKIAASIIEQQEKGINPNDPSLQKDLVKVNSKCEAFHENIYAQCKIYLKNDKKVGIIGGEHSVPLGGLKALSEYHSTFGILQIDAHCDLRKAYEGFTHSHASIMYNALQLPQISQLTQVGIRDYCEEEVDYIKSSNGRVKVFFDQEMKEAMFKGTTFDNICRPIIDSLPEKVYISFDVDGLMPALCPGTGTPVPGGLSFEQAVYLLKLLWQSGREIIGFDVCETGNSSELDANIAARIIYKLCNFITI